MPDFHSDSRDPRSQFDPLDTEGAGAQGNRPASGARQASPGQVLGGAFHGSANAGDFLGLDLEVGEPTAATTGAGGGLELASVEPFAAPETETSETEAMPAPAPIRAVAAPAPDALDEEFFEKPQRRFPMVQVGFAFALGLLIVAGVVLGPRFLEKKGDAAPAPSAGGNERTARAQPAATGTSGTTSVDDDAPASAVANDDGVDLVEGDETEGGTEILLAAPDESTPDEATTTTATDGQDGRSPSFGDLLRSFAAQEPRGPDATVVSALPQASQPIGGGRTTFDASLFAPEAWLTGEAVDMVWREDVVPLEAIAHPARIMTPRVGPVRVHMDGGEVFEGRLYAVGQKRVWLDADMGRLGLDGDHVTRFERLHVEQARSASFDSTSVGTGKRVRVLVPGGVLYGRVLSVDDTRITLITDEGARVTLDSPEIEPLGPSRAILVQR